MQPMNLLVYGDSRAMPRGFANIRVEDTWISLISKTHYTYFRGAGGTTSTEALMMFQKDQSYFFGLDNIIVIVLLGIVDAAPRPITYILKKLPFQPIWVLAVRSLEPFRAVIQRFWSYRIISPRKFRKNLENISQTCKLNNLHCIFIGNPIPPLEIDKRVQIDDS